MKFIAMNIFKIILGKEYDFENVWKTRETFLDNVEGFINFNLLRGDSTDEYTLYSSHSIWQSKEHFIAWKKSEAFRKAHRNAGENKPLYIGHPEFEGFNVVL